MLKGLFTLFSEILISAKLIVQFFGFHYFLFEEFFSFFHQNFYLKFYQTYYFYVYIFFQTTIISHFSFQEIHIIFKSCTFFLDFHLCMYNLFQNNAKKKKFALMEIIPNNLSVIILVRSPNKENRKKRKFRTLKIELPNLRVCVCLGEKE